MAKKETRKECPSCGLKLPMEAKVCEFCGYDLEEDDWISEIEELERKLTSKVNSSDATEAKVEDAPPLDEAPAEMSKPPAPPTEPEPEIEPEPREVPEEPKELSEQSFKCPTCGGDVVPEEEYCPHCGADLGEEIRWASQIEDLERELVVKRHKKKFASADEMIQSTIRQSAPERGETPTPPSIPEKAEPEPEIELEPIERPEGVKEAGKESFKCPTCGEDVGIGGEYCPNCGADIGEEVRWASQIEDLEHEISVKGETPEETQPGTIEEEFPPTDIIEPAAAESVIEAPEDELELQEQPEETVADTSEEPQVPISLEAAKSRFFDLREERSKQSDEEISPKAAMKTPAVDAQKERVYRKTTEGLVNGTRKGAINGLGVGRVNGTRQQGRVNGTKQGRVNGTGRGQVNGNKMPVDLAEAEAGPSRLRMMVGGRFQVWQLLTIMIVAMLVVASAVTYFTVIAGKDMITIDGVYSDWDSVPAYSFSQVIPGELNGINEGKIYYGKAGTTNKLYLYAELQNNLFAGTDVSTLYAFIDSDANPATGYNASESLGADLMIAISGWNGIVNSSSQLRFISSQDRSDWNSWESYSRAPCSMSGGSIEISSSVTTVEPLVQFVTSIGGMESRSPLMSPSGTILAKQTPLVDGSLAQISSPSVLKVSLIAMGVPDEDYVVQPYLVNGTGQSVQSATMSISTSTWTTVDLAADVSALRLGDGFKFEFTGVATGFQGPVDVIGRPSTGYYMQYPSQIVVDGLFADWNARKILDYDSVAVKNSDIDIEEYGAATQNGSHFMYVGTAGKTFEGADVPEQRVKDVGGEPGGSPGVRLKKTGEDLLRAYIDIDLAPTNGRIVKAENKSIRADWLIEIYGRNGIATSSSVMKWSSPDNWTVIGEIEKIGIGENGVEFSVSKALLGNLTNSEMIFQTTDWKLRSDNCSLNGALADPWIIRGTSTNADSYSSNDGIAWASTGSISLAPGDSIVALAHSLNRTYIFAITNSGRVYDWKINIDTSWGPDVTGPCNATNVVGLAPNSTGEGGFMIINAYGWTWTNASLNSRGWKNCTSSIAQGAYDFKDICSNATGGRYWAIRSGANTPAYYLETGQQWQATTGSTGSVSTQSHVHHIGDASRANEKIFILSENGNISYSGDGGATWGLRGDLPEPGTNGLPSYSRYVAIDRDGNGAFWAVTNTSYTYKSIDVADNWAYTSNKGVNDVVSLACPTPFIPEFDSILMPVFSVMFFAFAVLRKRRKQ